MKKTNNRAHAGHVKKGYNEHNPTQPHGAFSPASGLHKPDKKEIKSTTAEKKAKEDKEASH